MSANLSEWLTEGIDAASLENSGDIVIQSDASGGEVYSAYVRYYAYSNYSDYYNYYNYYYDYYNYYNYSNSISVTSNPISQIVAVGEVVSFVVRASNTIDSCQWYVADSATGVGTLIAGATSPTYSLVAAELLDGKYYYCVVRRGGNTATSTRALLTVKVLDVYDIYVAIGGAVQTAFVRTNPKETTIDSVSILDSSIATINSSGEITGKSLGSTKCTIIGSNGLSNTFDIHVIEDDLVAVLENTAIAIREYRGVTYSIYPNQMYNLLRYGEIQSKSYSSVNLLFTDIANAIRALNRSSTTLNPHAFYKEILSLI